MIMTSGLTRSFRVKGEPLPAVRDLDMRVSEGELLAFLGPNGAGKTTTLRMLTTLLPPSSGTAVVAGCDIVDDPAGVRRRIGYIGQGHGAGNEQRVKDELVTQGRCYGMSGRQAVNRADELIQSLGLEAVTRRPAGTLSGGQHRRLDIALGLMHQPALLFLDEPSAGLDPQSRENLWDHLLRLRKEHGVTIFLTTHYLEEADAMAERVLIIDHGKLIADGSPAELKADLAGDRISLTTRDAEEASVAAQICGRLPDTEGVQIDGAVVSVQSRRGQARLPELIRALDAGGAPPLAAGVTRATLDDVFLHLTGRNLREGDEGGAR
ncbi:ATP-binding cassette domain-containing protein [Actinomadura sp. KC06]|uniref:ATP-binding cassette domain-containing protein n=1 Tax=Actinomadura sp. KC06 TaxID=2530369 RepID=UPI001047FD13|nr:ATP-binding cassette domain-containing protein [Actinomadura sp. KC06]TDD37570.1 ATP-binding cassette domain-containing protein [Actinomadura sp. KC06]